MKNTIEQALGQRYKMYYSPAVPCHVLTPVLSLQQCVNKVNTALESRGQDFSHWEEHELNDLAKLVRANWIYQHLDQEPIRKPILVHPENNCLLVDTGDTRLMALNAKDSNAKVAVLATCNLKDSPNFDGWTEIDSTQRLLEVTDFDNESTNLIVSQSDSQYSAINWIEIGDASTGHHLHDQEQRIEMIKKYLTMQGTEYRFDLDWLKTEIAWKNLV